MKFSRAKKSVILFLIGFLFIVIDIDINTGISYPQDYDNSENIIGEFQYYNIKSTYGATCTYKLIDDEKINQSSNDSAASESAPSSQGAVVIDKVYFDNIHIDLFNDIIGFILIIFASLLLHKGMRIFNFAIITSIISLILNIVLFVFPFILNGILLCNFVFAIGFAYLFSTIIVTFFFTKGLLKLAPGIACRDERGWINTVWFICAVGMTLTTFVYWLGSDYHALITIGNVFTFVIVCLIATYYLLVKRIFDYIDKNYISLLSKK